MRTFASFLRRALELLYGTHVLVVFLVLGALALVLCLLPVTLPWRRRIAHWVASSFLTLAGIRVRLIDAHHLPLTPCVLVANHASYLDGVVLKAALPARFSFVIKKEVSRVPLAGLLLRRIGSEFVDRFNRHAGALDTRRIIKAAHSGQSLVLFPEGTFRTEPGVSKFHTGAFAIARRSAMPVVPLAIRGTRAILPNDRFLPRPGRIDLEFSAALQQPEEMDDVAAIAWMRDRARAEIVARSGEPDLIDNDGLSALQTARKAAS